MGNNRIATRKRTGLTVAQVGGNDIYKMLPQIRSIIELKGLGEEYTCFFAEPVESNGTIDWYAEEDGPVVQLVSLPEEEQKAPFERIKIINDTLKTYAAELKEKSGYRTYGDMLEKALLVPDDIKSFFLVNGKPVVAGWGFSTCDTSIVESCEIGAIISSVFEKKVLENEEKKNDGDESANVQPETPDNSDNVSNGPQEEAESPDAPQETEPAAVEETPPADTPLPPEKEKGKKPLASIAGIILLLILAAVAAWFFLNRPGPDMSFLKDRIEVTGVLADEKNNDVSLRMDFPDHSGKGMGYIEENEQSCQGDVVATLKGNDVLFQIGELLCPNKNNYDPFEITCPRGSKKCIGLNKDGSTWAVEIEIEK